MDDPRPEPYCEEPYLLLREEELLKSLVKLVGLSGIEVLSAVLVAGAAAEEASPPVAVAAEVPEETSQGLVLGTDIMTKGDKVYMNLSETFLRFC